MSVEKAKDTAGFRALEFIKEGMLIGLGTGSTATAFILHLIKKCKQGFKIRAVATSLESERLAKEGNIPLISIDNVSEIDLTVDGADEVDPQKRLIKGAGGALLREKIVANMSKEMVVIVDKAKCVDHLGKCPLPVEVTPFATKATEHQISSLGLKGSYRVNSDGSPFVTDNHNWIFDVNLPTTIPDPEKLHEALIHIPAVVETGFFFDLATKVIVGNSDGTTNIME